ncbi:MAG: ATP-binding protein [Nocardioides sp.]|uniref:ATP-binding protein n=1 Tax=Nocardioides sp. TaxID=35761 RepID=UPI0039E6FB64
MTLPFRPESVREARTLVRSCGDGFTEELLDDAELLASEVVTNAVRHGSPLVQFEVEVDGDSLTVRVSDGSVRLPIVRAADHPVDDPSGRGLRLVAEVATEWGVTTDSGADGKTVWFRLTDRRGSAGNDVEDETAWN